MPRLIDADKLEPMEVGIDEMSFLAVDYDDIKNAPTIEPNLVINPEEVAEGRVIEIGEDIIVMHHKDYYDMFTKSELYDGIEPCEDAISREAAIDALIETPREELEFDKGTGVIQELPTVAPNHSGEVTEMVEDAISRAEAMSAIYECELIDGETIDTIHSTEAIQRLFAVRKVAPSRPKGEWIIREVEFGNYKYQCKECGWYEKHAYNAVKPFNFCPNCGCAMTKE